MSHNGKLGQKATGSYTLRNLKSVESIVNYYTMFVKSVDMALALTATAKPVPCPIFFSL